MTEDGKYVQIPVVLSGKVALWVTAITLMVWGTMVGGPHEAESWALLITVAAASWTVMDGLGRQNEAMVHVFELGQESGRQQDVVRIKN